MKKKVIITAIVAASVGLVLGLKSAPEPGSEPELAAVPERAEQQDAATTTVLLFADPREAEANCGCAEIIRLARSAGDVEGVDLREIDTRKPDETAEQYAVRVSPAVLIVDQGGEVRHRFEGESREVVAGLRAVIGDLSAPAAEVD